MGYYSNRRSTPETRLLSGIVLIFISVVLLIFSAFSHSEYNAARNACTATALAEVIDVDKTTFSNKGSSHTEYSATLKIDSRDYEGETVRTDWSVKSFQRGDTVTVKYNPDRTSQFYVDGYMADKSNILSIMASIVGAMGVGFLLIYILKDKGRM